ncbi:MAG TPA: MoxR family ATPase [Vicinamibacterales bacterium]|nr:MoxR family ATPase [Vicinamibacterales bacterium]
MTAPTQDDLTTQAAIFRDCFEHLRAEIGRVFVGHADVVEHLLLCFFCQGHALLEGAPGLGKTLLVRTLADAVSLRFTRIQCTPDLMPGDVTGTNVLTEAPDGSRVFRFQPGPIFGHVVLADEINRATPRTQAAFLEAMQERRVTIFGVTHPLDEPFCVLATQNPLEMEGTYPLPEAQLDRFFFKLTLGMPGVAELAEIMARTTGDATPHVTARYGADGLRPLLALVRHVKIGSEVMRLALRLVRATHPDADEAPAGIRRYVKHGASPRAAQAIVLASKARALLAGRFHASSEDVLSVALPALAHRLILNFQGEMDRVSTASLVRDVMASVSE